MNTTEYHADHIYLAGLRQVLENGHRREDRTGTGTISMFGTQQRYDLTAGFPLLTSKKVYTRGVFGELLWFLQGRTDNQWLQERRITIWDEWQDEHGDLGPIYGYQWRHFSNQYLPQRERDQHPQTPGVDQISNLLHGLRHEPFSRRHIVSAWNPLLLEHMALPPCHTMFQCYVTPDTEGKPQGLSLQLYQRSGDKFLGEPFNIASYAALTHLLADLSGLIPLEFIHTMGDAHIYTNHVEQVREQLSRESHLPAMPTLHIAHPADPETLDLSDPQLFEHYSPESFHIEDYSPLPAIKAPVAV